MTRARTQWQECPIAEALAEIGDWWTLLIVREAIYGTRHFEAFRRELGVARNILADRLAALVENGILDRKPDPDDGRSVLYTLTAKGRSLWPVLAALVLWSNRWLAEPDRPVIEIRDGQTGEPLVELVPRDVNGVVADIRTAMIAPGPGASPAFAERWVNRPDRAASKGGEPQRRRRRPDK
jgi:DNA-binding HxlR family transcriptional regulator